MKGIKKTREEAEALEAYVYHTMALEGLTSGLTPEWRESIIQKLMKGEA